MHRGRKESARSSIPKLHATRPPKRSISTDNSAMNRGSYLPTNRRTSSADRFLTPASAMKPYRGISPKESFGGNFRRSSLLDKKGIVKDSRPLADKSYQRQCAQQIANFLEKANCPFHIVPSDLYLPSKKEYENIFVFLYRLLDSRFEMKKLEDSVPNAMKILNYPYLLNKSSFLTITHMVWPSLLGVLMYLMNLTKFILSTDPFMCNNEDFENQEIFSIKVNYIIQSFASGNVDSQKDEQIFALLASDNENPDVKDEDIEQEIKELEAMIEQESEEIDKYSNMVESNDSIEKDIIASEKYIAEMQECMQQKNLIYNEEKTQKNEKESELAAIQQSISMEEDALNNQGYDGNQFQNLILSKKNSCMDSCHKQNEHLKSEQKLIWDLEIDISREIDGIKSLCNNFNMQWPTLQSAATATLAPLKDSKVSAAAKLYQDYNVPLPEFKLHERIDGSYPEINNIKEMVKKQMNQMSNIIDTQDQHLSELEMKASKADMKEKLVVVQMEKIRHQLEMETENDQKEKEDFQSKLDSNDQPSKQKEAKHSSLKEKLATSKKTSKTLNLELIENEEKFQTYEQNANLGLKKFLEHFKNRINEFESLEAASIEKTRKLHQEVKSHQQTFC